MATNTDGGTTASLSNTPQAKDDFYGLAEDYLGISYFDVMLNDLGGKAKVLWSIDDGSGSPTDLISQDLGRAESTMGDKSAHGANIWITSDGKIGYDGGSLTQDFKDTLQELALGETATDTFTYAIRLANGTLSWATVTIEYSGANDPPIANADVNGQDLVIESGVHPGDTSYAGDASASGNVLANDTDVDNGAVLTVADVNGSAANVGSTVTGTFGSVTINSDGSWTYNLNNGDADTEALAQGETQTEVFTYTVTDEHGATSSSTLTITITGTNDGPVANADSDTTSENAAIDVDVLANDTDVDDGAVLTVTAASAPAGQGTASVVANQVRFDPGTDFDHLNVGDSEVVTVSYTITDEHGATSSSTVEITVTGTNDAPALTGTQATLPAGTEDQSYIVSKASLLQGFTDPDSSDVLGVMNLSADHGTIIDNGDGTYTVTPTANYNGSVTLSYDVVDGNGGSVAATLSFNLAAVNDPAVITGDIEGAVIEATPANPGDPDDTGQLLAADVDNTPNTFMPVASTATASGYGSYSISASGLWSYTLNNANPTVNALAAGVLLIDTFTVYSADGTPQTITVTITGAADVVAATNPTTYTGADPNDNDNLSGGAVVSGNFNAGSGDDTFTGDSGGQTLNGGGGDDNIYGAGGNDNIDGGGDDDTLYGQAGDDDISGNNGLDIVYGGSGADEINGGNDADTIYGGSGNDTIVGHNGNDVIIGGYGADILTGSGGDDIFRYLDKLDTNDTITDFRASGLDQLDLNGIDANDLMANNQDFVWGGDDGPIANGLWFSYDAVTGDTTLYGDTNGNLANAEFMLVLQDFNGFATYGNPGPPPPTTLIDG